MLGFLRVGREKKCQTKEFNHLGGEQLLEVIRWLQIRSLGIISIDHWIPGLCSFLFLATCAGVRSLGLIAVSFIHVVLFEVRRGGQLSDSSQSCVLQ